MAAKQNAEQMGMVERVARAIVGPHRPVPAGSPYTLERLRDVRWQQANNTERQNALNEARAAIKAIREPSEAMRRAGQAAYLETLCDDSEDEAIAIFNAMIDAALKEPENG